MSDRHAEIIQEALDDLHGRPRATTVEHTNVHVLIDWPNGMVEGVVECPGEGCRRCAKYEERIEVTSE